MQRSPFRQTSTRYPNGTDVAYIAAKANEAIEYAKANDFEVRFSWEVSFRSDFANILKLYSLVAQLRANRVGIAGTVGGAAPLEVFEKVSTLHKVVGYDIETHFHSDTGCATANAYVALKAGATYVDTTVLGIGERNGITPLSGLIASLVSTDRKCTLRKYKIEKLSCPERLIAQIVGVEIPFDNFVPSLQSFD